MLRIKKAYRKKALELHPDRNYGKVEAATKRFANVQSAYEVLSDPQERAWYDSHRDSILRGGDNDGEHYEHNVRVTTAKDIMGMFSKFNSQIDFSDSPTGFYGALRDFFDNLTREEEVACEWDSLNPVRYPSFGHKDDDYNDVVRPFYAMWNSFATKKSFSWKDAYNYSEAPDRKIRRMMEKENKRFRDESVREFNDAVRSLVAFVRKRDPRFKPNMQSEADRQKALRDATVAQAARSRAANEARFTMEAVPEWMRASATDSGEMTDNEWAEISPAKQDVECVLCNKTFKSEKQYEAHEKSKKHIKAVKQIQHQMQREDQDMKLDARGRVHDSPNEYTADIEDLQSGQEEKALEHPNTECRQSSREKSAAMATDIIKNAPESQDHGVVSDGSELESASDEDYAPREKVKQRLFDQGSVLEHSNVLQGPIDESPTNVLAEKFADESLVDVSETIKKSRLGKAKGKRAKRVAQQSSASAQVGAKFECTTCQEGFPSKTRLFSHIKDLGHARPVQKVTKGGKGKR